MKISDKISGLGKMPVNPVIEIDADGNAELVSGLHTEGIAYRDVLDWWQADEDDFAEIEITENDWTNFVSQMRGN
jgi:hypothetical protein